MAAKKSVPFLIILTYILWADLLNAQTDSTIFMSQRRVETNEYVFNVPDKWKYLGQVSTVGKDQKFDFSGISLPIELNNAPLTATFTLRKYECATLRPAEDFIITEFTAIPDRITRTNNDYERDSLKIQSGENATFLSTHYYRRNKIFNYSRYDILAYSHKRKAAYIATIIFQYKDPTYAVVADLRFKDYAVKVFKTLLLR